MSRSSRVLIALLASLVPLAACGKPAPSHEHAATLAAFRSEADFTRTLAAWKARVERDTARVRREAAAGMPPPPAAPIAMSAPMQGAVAADAGAVGESITNNQVQGVDEGDIVKRQGDMLIVLRRGRLFTVRVGGDALQPVASVDAFGPDVDPNGTWYDEMLVSDGTVAVIGYSYARGGTEVGLFDLDARGRLAYRGTYQLRSGDYYSARNYASRLIGHTLVFYSPLSLSPWADWRASLPGYRRWRGDPSPTSFRRMLPATRIYRGTDEIDDDATLHTVSVCDLSRRDMQCASTAVLGGSGRVFHVSNDAVYVWANAGRNARGSTRASVFRLPLDGSAPSALRAWGSPADQMGFLQRDGWLNVLVTRSGDGDGMWRSGRARGELALLRVPLTAFGDARASARRAQYRLLPGGAGWNLQQRFIGDWLIYGMTRADAAPVVRALRYASNTPVQTLPLAHSLERIEALGGDGVLVGNDGRDLVFTALRLSTPQAALAGAYRRPDAQQGDSRTHGFFYRPTGPDGGVLGLPIVAGERSASVLYLRNRALRLSTLGTLDSRVTQADDACRASCFDWYGNARPIFLGERVFALMGYELVEGRLGDAGIRERRRVDMTPHARIAD